MKIILGCLLIASSAFKTTAQTKPEEIDELLKAYTTQGSFNGAALVAQKGKVLIQKGYGYKNAAAKTFNDSNSIFQIGSLTKQFTAAIILYLQQQKKLSVEDKLSKYIPDYPRGGSITIENLLTHTSGIHNYNDEAFMKNNATRHIRTDSLIALFKYAHADFKPGEKYNYSNSNYVLLGFIIETVTGKSYYDVVREDIFQPLGMFHSGFDFGSLKTTEKAAGYSKLNPKLVRTAAIVDSSVTYAAGSIYSTVGDLYKWDRALYTNRILDDSSLRKAFTPYKNNYGYGWLIDSAYGKKAVLHEGGTLGFSAFIGRVQEDSLCIILLDNKESIGLLKIAEDINAILNNEPYDFPKPRTQIEVSEATLRLYTGNYQLTPEILIAISIEDGQLVAKTTGDGRAELFAEKENYFFLKMTDMQFEFIKNATGKISKLILYDHGQKLEALKIK
ncbi:MAG TPA: serine hydrolase [Puia sp.]|nr:serine hydrolase [Puia sp.]